MRRRITPIMGTCLAAVILLLLPAGTRAQSDTNLDAFLKKAESSDQVCQIPATPGSLFGQATGLDVETSNLTKTERKRLVPVLDEMKRLQRLNCARLHLCQLGASHVALIAADRILSLEQKWNDETRRVQIENPGREDLPIQTQQLAAELQRSNNELAQDRARVEDAARAESIERTAIQTISELPDEEVSHLAGAIMYPDSRLDLNSADKWVDVPRPDLQLKILMSRTLFPQTSKSVERWARNEVRIEIFSAIQLLAEKRQAAEQANNAFNAVWSHSRQLPIPPPSTLNLPADVGWLYYGFQRGAVPADDLLWALRRAAEAMDASAQAEISAGAAAAGLVCASGVNVMARIKLTQ
jgi:hypothetical protein